MEVGMDDNLALSRDAEVRKHHVHLRSIITHPFVISGADNEMILTASAWRCQ